MKPKNAIPSAELKTLKSWFESHICLDGKPYTLDESQAAAVFDDHKNTLVTARAGSGKTRVIVAKVAYLLAKGYASPSEIAVFMFNRTAAAEVNQRIGAVTIDGVDLKSKFNHGREIRIASTFHKFALDLIKSNGESPEIISEAEHAKLIRQSFDRILEKADRRLPKAEYVERLKLISTFISRAGQKYPGGTGLSQLCHDVKEYIKYNRNDPIKHSSVILHRLALATYQEYLLTLKFPRIDFNMLMSRAANLLLDDQTNPAEQKVAKLGYILVDEYQDFSFLFYNMIQGLRHVCPRAHLFCVGDDWQAINRFAGSDVDYFINFAKYFPENTVNIPLVMNYRSCRKVVENANKFMLKNYDKTALPAVPFNKSRGKIKLVNPSRTKFDQQDYYEDALGDAKYQIILAKICGGQPKNYLSAARYLKTLLRIIKSHRRDQILLLHRHNFTSFAGLTLDNLQKSLKALLTKENIMTESTFESQIRLMTMHKSKGLESTVVILLECESEMILAHHPHAATFTIFGDSLATEKSDQFRLLYVALTRAKEHLYILSSDKKCPLLP